MVAEQHGFQVIVDYAHTPHALEILLESCTHLCTGRVILVFGCGGDRDYKKRPLMAKIAENYSEKMIITDDNPRNEDPNKIFNDIVQGFENSNYEIIQNREQAIMNALEKSNDNNFPFLFIYTNKFSFE